MPPPASIALSKGLQVFLLKLLTKNDGEIPVQIICKTYMAIVRFLLKSAHIPCFTQPLNHLSGAVMT